MFNLNEVEEKMEVLEYLYFYDFISRNEFIIGLQMRKAFRKRKFFCMSMKFTKYGIQIKGGKTIDQLPEIIESNKRWHKIEQILTKYQLFLIEKYIGVEKLMNTVTENEEKEVLELMNTLNEVLYEKVKKDEVKLDFNEKIVMLERLVRNYGIRRTERETGIDHKTLKKIFTYGNFNFSKLNSLFKFFNLN